MFVSVFSGHGSYGRRFLVLPDSCRLFDYRLLVPFFILDNDVIESAGLLHGVWRDYMILATIE